VPHWDLSALAGAGALRSTVADLLRFLRLTPRGSDHELLFHNGGTGGFRSFTGFAPATDTAAVMLSNSARSVDPLGFRILERIGATLQSWAASV
jgi:serine-type D-Ala-D-Ala carboxypeptidase/endopeptidase